MHGILLSLVLGTAGLSLGLLAWSGLPVAVLGLAYGGAIILCAPLGMPAWRNPHRIAVFGSAGFIAACREAAPAARRVIVHTARSELMVGGALLRFLIASKVHRPAVILLQIPDQAEELRHRLPQLVEGLPALVLRAVPAEALTVPATTMLLGQRLAVVAPGPLRPWQHACKRLLDLAITLPALLLLAPLLLGIGIAIRLESTGPALFRQLRIGRLGVPFVMLKFRSMRIDAPGDGGAGTERDDPRITPLGRWLRATSLDEMPQLINVVLGHMSIVGPRPHMAEHRVESGVYTQVVSEYAARHRVTPGITGLAQISGMRGGIQTIEKAKRSVALDLAYISRFSFWSDIRIILRTLVGGMAGRDVF